MLKYIKRQINELLDTLEEVKQAVAMAIVQADEAGLMNILADAQGAAIAIGNKIESSERDEAPEEAVGGAEEITDRKALENSICEAGEGIDCETPGNSIGEAKKGTDRETPGNSVCKTVGSEHGAENCQAVKLTNLLETYCELLWELTQEGGTEKRLETMAGAWELLDGVRQGVKGLPEQFAIVFMPYKASMWDCMESVWQAACDDPEWVPFVVPIPYMDLKDGQITATHYEGGDLPPEVPIAIYSDFPLEQMHPEAIYIHNPFDDINLVTTVLPQYYSAELKKHTDRLIYCPYYVTGDAVFVTHRFMPSYGNMDFIVTQCEKMIDSYSAQIPREKFLPFGSPIADRIMRMEKEKPAIPDTWKGQLKNGKDFGGDRAVMLNTSISLFMKQRERFLDKIEYLLELAKRTRGITLVWRPHPLLHSTAQTMGESYAARLAALENKFLEEKIGVLDQTQDVGVTVALCDAYLGETASSMIHMFGIAGKPRFYINLQIPDHGKAEDAFLTSGFCQAGEKEYYLLDQSGWIVERDKSSGKERLLARVPGREFVPGRAYGGMEYKEGSLWVYPEREKGILIYQIENGRMRRVFENEEGMSGERPEAGSGSAAEADMNGRNGEILFAAGEECLAAMRAELFQRDNPNHEWYENEKNSVEDFFHFLQTAQDDQLTGYQGAYPIWLATLDGSCGKKVLRAVRESLK